VGIYFLSLYLLFNGAVYLYWAVGTEEYRDSPQAPSVLLSNTSHYANVLEVAQ
jgi:hypothetical protein